MICHNLKRLFFNGQNEHIASLIHLVCNRIDQTIDQAFGSVKGIHNVSVYFHIALFVLY